MLSILVHAAIVVALTFSIPLGVSRQVQPNAVVIETVLVDETAVIAEMARIESEQQAVVDQREDEARLAREQSERLLREQEEQEQRQRDEEVRIQRETEEALQRAETERIRLAREAEALAEQERIDAEQRAEQERVEREAEAARIEAERQRELEEAARLERERLAAEERAREEARIEAERQARIAAIEAETQRAIEAEQQARAAQDSGLRDQWARAISDRVRRYWNQPPNVAVGLECVLEVTQLPNGVVVGVEIERCNTTDQTIIRSVENAVLNASPLPGPPGNVAFERVIIITFRPDE